jgi:hypothetical protein
MTLAFFQAVLMPHRIPGERPANAERRFRVPASTSINERKSHEKRKARREHANDDNPR